LENEADGIGKKLNRNVIKWSEF